MFISVHGSHEAAKKAAQQHLERYAKSLDLNDPNTKNLTKSANDFHKLVMVKQDDYHSFAVEVTKEELLDGTVIPAETKANGAKAGDKRKAAQAADEDDEDDFQAAKDGDDEEEEEDEDEDEDADGGAPNGEPNCLSGLRFLITGTLEGFNRREATDLIEEYGGTMEKTLKQDLDYVVLGVKAGPKKLEQIEQWGLETLDQKGLYALIASRPAGPKAEPVSEKRASKRGKKA